ncbi:MAG: hypothetical protein E7434_09145 [Ruminococcaceae bacterium]|nr:hypothetical protein [Oscillospiraceae bacterium]
MIDLHCHIIPYIDDGAKSIEIACAMAKHAYRTGVDTIVATPHCNLRNARPNYRDREYSMVFSTFRAILKQKQIPIKLLPGAEVFAHEENIRRLIDEEMLVTLNHSRYLLVEFPFHGDGRGICRTLEAIARRGLIPVIAHPERYDAVQDRPDLVEHWFSQGFVIQINKGSLLGRLGNGAQKTSLRLLYDGFAHVIASDAHDMRHRPPGFLSLTESLNIDPRYLHMLLHDNPSRIINDEPLPRPGDDFYTTEEGYR